jgi:hypothetical protein
MADHRKVDKELEQYRGLLERSETFEGGFGWTTIAGILFCGLIMMPGGIYLGLMTGVGLGGATTWVTLILFGEVARRALKSMSKGNLVILLHAAGIMMSAGVFGELVYRAFFVTCEAVRDSGMSDSFPTWWVPKPDSAAILERSLFHRDWIKPIALATFGIVAGFVNKYTVGYFLFRLTSDVESLPFPMAPISAQGVLAMTEQMKSQQGDERKSSLLKRVRQAAAVSVEKENAAIEAAAAVTDKRHTRWRLFSLGALLGLSFGAVQIGIPLVSGMFLDKPIMLLPIPFLDTTTLTESILPAAATGITLDLGMLLTGMVLPFWSIIGTAIAVCMTVFLNPIMHKMGILTQWQPGMDTINTTFVNGIDFWTSFGLGTTFAIAVISIYSTARDITRIMRRRKRERLEDVELTKEQMHADETSRLWRTPNLGRGDYPLWIALVLYILVSAAMVLVCNHLIPGLLPFLLFFVFFYNPFISYVSARLLGISGQTVDIPFLRESAVFASGAKGVDIWVAPIPIINFGGMAQSYRVNELVGVNFRSLIVTDLVATPIMLLLSCVFWAFIWKSDPIPSDVFPASQINWELQSKNQALVYSSTFVAPGSDPAQHSILNSPFMQAIHPPVIAGGAVLTLVSFTLLSIFGLPTLLIYGVVRGLGGLPHTMILQIAGAFIGKYYFHKRFGSSEFLRMVPTVLSGYFAGVGLISMIMVSLTLITKAVSTAPF